MDDGKHPSKRRKRFEFQSNPVLTNAMRDYMAAQGIESEGRAAETLVREGLAIHGHLPAKK